MEKQCGLRNYNRLLPVKEDIFLLLIIPTLMTGIAINKYNTIKHLGVN